MGGVSLMAYIATSAYAIVWGGFGAGTIAVLVSRAGLLGAQWTPHVTSLISLAADAACIPWIEGRRATIWVLETGFRGPIDSDCGSGPEGGRSSCDRPAGSTPTLLLIHAYVCCSCQRARVCRGSWRLNGRKWAVRRHLAPKLQQLWSEVAMHHGVFANQEGVIRG